MCKMRQNRDSKWEPDWGRRCDGGQADQGKVLEDCCHLTSASEALCSSFEGHVFIFFLFSYI